MKCLAFIYLFAYLFVCAHMHMHVCVCTCVDMCMYVYIIQRATLGIIPQEPAAFWGVGLGTVFGLVFTDLARKAGS